MADNPNTGGGKIRSRRAAPSRKPYSRASSQRKSLLSRVTDSVKSLLNPIAPRWLVNRISSDEEPQSPQAFQDQDSEQPSTSGNHQQEYSRTNNYYNRSPLSRPPLKNATKTSTSSLFYVTPPDTPPQETVPKAVASSGDTGKEGLLKHLSMASKRAKMELDSPLPSDSSFLRNELKMLSTNDNASVASSSGCSSSVQVGSHRNLSDNESSQKPVWSSSMESLASSRTSSSRQQATMSSQKRPRFNPALFGMPALGVSRSSDGFQSSFYEGPVQFGGANASGRSPHFATPYKIPMVTKVKVRHVNHQRTPARSSASSSRSSRSPMNESSAVGMSSTAKKILQTLEKMSSPLNDARKIPTMARTPSSFAADRIKRRTVAGTSALGNSLPPPISGLSSPSSAGLRRRSHMPANNSLLVKRKQGDSKVDKTNDDGSDEPGPSKIIVPDSKAVSIRGLPAPIASMSSSAAMPKPKSQSAFGSEGSGGGGKMKSQRKAAHYSSMHDDEEEEEAPNLPNVALPVSSLPSFNFGKSMMTSTPAVRGPEKRAQSNGKQPEFNFASPVIKTTETDQGPTSTNTPKFQFSSPPTKGSSVETEQDTPKAHPSMNFAAGGKPGTSPLLFAPDPKVVSAVKASKRRSSPLATPNSDSAPSGMRPAESLKSGNVLDILGGKTKYTQSDNTSDPPTGQNLPPLRQVKTGWTCDVCLVQNKDTADSCAACANPKPGGGKKPPLSSIFTQKKGWECGTCLVRNDADKEKCACCEAPQPGSNATPKGDTFKATDFGSQKQTFSFGVPPKKDSDDKSKDSANGGNSLAALFKKPKGTWECSVCLVQNTPASTNCAACQNVKPGTTPSASSSSNNTAASTKTPQYQFGITTSSAGSAEKKEKSSGWGGLWKKPTSKWECEVCMVFNPDEQKTCQACNSPRPGTKKEFNTSFKFGENSSGLYKFGVPSTSASQSEIQKDAVGSVQQKSETTQSSTPAVQTVATNAASTDTSKPSFPFGIPATKTPVASVGSAPTFGITAAKTDTPPPAYSFGQKTAASETPDKKENENTQPKDLFVFGAQKKQDSTESAKAPGFNAPSSSVGFSFGAKPQSSENPANDAKNVTDTTSQLAPPSNPLLGVLGAKTSTQEKITQPSVFGSTAASTTQSGLFQFGSKQMETKVFTVPETEPEVQNVPAPSFAFGGPKSKPVGTFQFSGTTSSTIPPTDTAGKKPLFSFGSGNTNKPSEASKPTGFGAASADAPKLFSGFGNTVTQVNQPETQKTEEKKPAFSGFGSSQAPSSQPAGIFGGPASSNPPPFSNSSTSLAFSANADSKSSPFSTPSTKSTIFGSGSNSGSAFGGASSVANTAPSASSSISIFGNNSSTTAFGTQQPSVTTSSLPKPSFAFGAGATNESTQEKTAGFSFGNSSTQPANANFAFGTGNALNNSTSQPSTGFNFGATPSKPAFNPGPASGGFAFGNSTPSQNNGIFQFGAGANAQTSTAQPPPKDNGIFMFGTGGNADAGAKATSGFNFSGSAAPSFNFTAGQSSTPQPGAGAPVFQMGEAAPNQNPFNQSGSSTTPIHGRRKIQARRRNLKK